MFDDSMKAIGKGGLTKNSELSYSNAGTAFLKFSIGVSKSRKIKGTEDYEQKSHYFNCVIIGKFAETMVNHLKKGTKVFVVGDLQHSTYEKDGVNIQKYEIIVGEIEIVAKAKEDNNQNNSSGNSRSHGNYSRNQGSNNNRNNHYVSDNPDDYYANGINRMTGEYCAKFDLTK